MERARAIGSETAEADRQMEEINASLERAHRRGQLACQIAAERFLVVDDIEIVGRPIDPDDSVYIKTEDGVAEYVDGGYWVEARIFVDFETVEDRMPVVEDASAIEADPMAAQRRGE